MTGSGVHKVRRGLASSASPHIFPPSSATMFHCVPRYKRLSAATLTLVAHAFVQQTSASIRSEHVSLLSGAWAAQIRFALSLELCSIIGHYARTDKLSGDRCSE